MKHAIIVMLAAALAACASGDGGDYIDCEWADCPEIADVVEKPTEIRQSAPVKPWAGGTIRN